MQITLYERLLSYTTYIWIVNLKKKNISDNNRVVQAQQVVMESVLKGCQEDEALRDSFCNLVQQRHSVCKACNRLLLSLTDRMW